MKISDGAVNDGDKVYYIYRAEKLNNRPLFIIEGFFSMKGRTITIKSHTGTIMLNNEDIKYIYKSKEAVEFTARLMGLKIKEDGE